MLRAEVLNLETVVELYRQLHDSDKGLLYGKTYGPNELVIDFSEFLAVTPPYSELWLESAFCPCGCEKACALYVECGELDPSEYSVQAAWSSMPTVLTQAKWVLNVWFLGNYDRKRCSLFWCGMLPLTPRGRVIDRVGTRMVPVFFPFREEWFASHFAGELNEASQSEFVRAFVCSMYLRPFLFGLTLANCKNVSLKNLVLRKA